MKTVFENKNTKINISEDKIQIFHTNKDKKIVFISDIYSLIEKLENLLMIK